MLNPLFWLTYAAIVICSAAIGCPATAEAATLVTEPELMLVLENVVVNPPPNQEIDLFRAPLTVHFLTANGVLNIPVPLRFVFSGIPSITNFVDVNPPWLGVWNAWDGFSKDDRVINGAQDDWRFAMKSKRIFDGGRKGCGAATYRCSESMFFEDDVRPVCSCHGSFGNAGLLFGESSQSLVDLAVLSGGAPKSECEPRDEPCGHGGNGRTGVVKGFFDMPEPDRDKVIGGAIFVLGIAALAAYIVGDVLERRNLKRENQKKAREDKCCP